MNNFFNLDFERLVALLLPVRLRLPRMVAWLKCLIQPVRELYHRFFTNRESNLYTLQHTGQVVYLQAALNDTFDPVLRRIYLTEASFADSVYVYLVAENRPVWLGVAGEALHPPVPLYTRGEVTTSGYHFIIMIPAGLTYDMQRLRSLTDKYRLPSKNNYITATY